MSAKTKDVIIKEAEKISSLIATARRLMAENKSVDLSKLEHKISNICKKARTTDLKQSEEIQGVLVAIVEDLNRLDDKITSLYKKTEYSSLKGNTKRAIDAYGLDDKES
tara:strand:+ start:322 stop:648 length:327 start_codon:yes stop_codon:yes gene_type:complete